MYYIFAKTAVTGVSSSICLRTSFLDRDPLTHATDVISGKASRRNINFLFLFVFVFGSLPSDVGAGDCGANCAGTTPDGGVRRLAGETAATDQVRPLLQVKTETAFISRTIELGKNNSSIQYIRNTVLIFILLYSIVARFLKYRISNLAVKHSEPMPMLQKRIFVQ